MVGGSGEEDCAVRLALGFQGEIQVLSQEATVDLRGMEQILGFISLLHSITLRV